MQEVRSSNLLSSTGQNHNSNNSNSKYSSKVQQRRPAGPPYVCSDRPFFPRQSCWQDTGSEAPGRRCPACHLGESPPHRSCDPCRLVTTRPSWRAVSTSDCCRICRWSAGPPSWGSDLLLVAGLPPRAARSLTGARTRPRRVAPRAPLQRLPGGALRRSRCGAALRRNRRTCRRAAAPRGDQARRGWAGRSATTVSSLLWWGFPGWLEGRCCRAASGARAAGGPALRVGLPSITWANRRGRHGCCCSRDYNGSCPHLPNARGRPHSVRMATHAV